MMIKEAWSTCGQYSGNGQHGQHGGNSQHGQCDQYGGNVQHGQHEFQFLIFYFMKRYMNGTTSNMVKMVLQCAHQVHLDNQMLDDLAIDPDLLRLANTKTPFDLY